MNSQNRSIPIQTFIDEHETIVLSQFTLNQSAHPNPHSSSTALSSPHGSRNNSSFNINSNNLRGGSEMQLSGRMSSDDFEVSVLSSTDGCYWRLEYIKNIAIPGHLKCALAFLNYPVVRRCVGDDDGQ